MTKPVEPSAQSRLTLSALQRAVSNVLDRKPRLGQYAVVWQDGAATVVGGEIDQMDEAALLGERTFLRDQLAGLPASEQLARTNARTRLDQVELMIASKQQIAHKAI